MLRTEDASYKNIFPDENLISQNTFYKVYKGQLSHSGDLLDIVNVAFEGIQDTGAIASSRTAEIYRLDILAQNIQVTLAYHLCFTGDGAAIDHDFNMKVVGLEQEVQRDESKGDYVVYAFSSKANLASAPEKEMLKLALDEFFFELVIYWLQNCGDHGSGFLPRCLLLRVACNPGRAITSKKTFSVLLFTKKVQYFIGIGAVELKANDVWRKKMNATKALEQEKNERLKRVKLWPNFDLGKKLSEKTRLGTWSEKHHRTLNRTIWTVSIFPPWVAFISFSSLESRLRLSFELEKKLSKKRRYEECDCSDEATCMSAVGPNSRGEALNESVARNTKFSSSTS
ncbi:hypothetical protein Tco_1164855 [Tanacetum coccineum]